jgi:hypothetical protein
MFCLRAVGGPYRANVFFLGGGLLPIDWPAGPQTLRHIRAASAPYRAVFGPYRANVFSWSRAGYQYIGPLGHNPFGTYVPHQPCRGDILVAKHRRASVFKAPAGRHIGSKASVQWFLYARSAAPTGPTCSVGRGLATNILARWATIPSAHTGRKSPVGATYR